MESIEHSVQPEDLLHGLLGRLFKPASVDQVDEAARHDVLAGKIELKMNSSYSMKYTLCTICGNSFRIQIEAELHSEVLHMHKMWENVYLAPCFLHYSFVYAAHVLK